MWIPLQLFGIQPFRAALEEKLLLTRYCYQNLKEMDGIEIGPKPELSVVFFRYVPDPGDANAFNRKLVNLIHEDGRLFISSTHVDDTIYLRIAILNFRTHKEEVDLILSMLQEKIKKLETI